MAERVWHTLPPVYDENSRILILGSIPSPKSRENGFYYGHPQNRFWPVLAEVLQAPLPVTNGEKRQLALDHGIALWDVLASCLIQGADDSSIREAQANDIPSLLAQTKITAIFTTGRKAHDLYQRHCAAVAGLPAIYLPSTSPANQGRYPKARLVAAYEVILDYLG